MKMMSNACKVVDVIDVSENREFLMCDCSFLIAVCCF